MFAFRRTLLRRLVVVNLRTGGAIEGALVARRGPLLILKGATVHDADGSSAKADGELVVDRSVVDFIQVLPTIPER